MTVEELIAELQKLNPKLPVTVSSGERGYTELVGAVRSADGVHWRPVKIEQDNSTNFLIKEGPHVRIG